jgi:hypothetical protein
MGARGVAQSSGYLWNQWKHAFTTPGGKHSLVTLSVFAFTSTHLRSFCLFISSSSSLINIHISASFISFTLLKVCSSFVRSDVQIILSYRDKGKFYPLSQTWKPRKGKRVNGEIYKSICKL